MPGIVNSGGVFIDCWLRIIVFFSLFSFSWFSVGRCLGGTVCAISAVQDCASMPWNMLCGHGKKQREGEQTCSYHTFDVRVINAFGLCMHFFILVMQLCELGRHFVQFVVRPQNPWAQRAISNMLGPQWTNWRLFGGFCLFPPFPLVFCVAPLFGNFNASGVVLDALGVLFVVSVLSCFYRCFAMSWVQTKFLFMFGIAEILRTQLYWNVSFFCDFFFENNFRLHRYFCFRPLNHSYCVWLKDSAFVGRMTYICFAPFPIFLGFQIHLRQFSELPEY